MLRALIEQSSSKLRRAASGVPDELFGKRPGRSLNPIGFIYFHVLRSWDEDLNVLCRNLAPDDDTWHRAGLSDGESGKTNNRLAAVTTSRVRPPLNATAAEAMTLM